MLARLWWKEWRAFGPIWLILILAATGVQLMDLTMQGDYARDGSLTPLALFWGVIYGLAAGSAAFAGERDSGTMGFLEALPIGRPKLWLGKALFALVSTYGLASLLAILAALGTTRRNPIGSYGYSQMALIFGTLLFEGVAWGLFWSSLSKNPLLAGGLGVVSVFVSVTACSQVASADSFAPEAVVFRVLVASVALGLSALALIYRDWISVPRLLSARTRIESDLRRDIPVRAASAARSLDWQAWREGLTTGFLVILLMLVIPLALKFSGSSNSGPFELFLGVLGILVAGVAVFGAEGGSATPRFLAHHGVRPGVVWARRLWIWGLAISVILAIFLLCFARLGPLFGGGGPSGADQLGYGILPIAAILIDAFAVGLICGMAIPRRITAVLVGTMGILLIAPIHMVLVVQEMVPPWTMLLTPAILIGASRAWVGEWMTDREGFHPWLRLGLLLVVPFGLHVPCYIAWRAWGIPDVGPQYAASRSGVVSVPPGQDASEAYRLALDLVRNRSGLDLLRTGSNPEIDSVIDRGWNSEQTGAGALWRENGPAIEAAREAATRPLSGFKIPESMTLLSGYDPVSAKLPLLGMLLALDTRERLARDDLTGAWADILAQLRMANHLAEGEATLSRMASATILHHRAIGLAIDWAGHPQQTAETIRRARDSLKSIPPLPTATETLRAESLLIDRTLDLPVEDLHEILLGQRFSSLIASWWERIHARRLARRMIADLIPEAEREPWQRTRDVRLDPRPEGSPLARLIFPAFQWVIFGLDSEMVGRRALDQILALRSWQFAHDGKYPDQLDEIVPTQLDRLPSDPYSGKPFGYVRSEGQPVLTTMAISNKQFPTVGTSPTFQRTREGQPILYSIGRDGKDDGGHVKGAWILDIAYPAPLNRLTEIHY
ncbi:ABC transporter permease [Tundrisphaera lichenicola]|uniref:ABC transporter permease n=1 Tax=Tundrisphaera lichenicola TaxID=2029860 RepID=UPI003EB9AC53